VSIRDFFRARRKFFLALFLVAFCGALAVGAVLLYRYQTGPDRAFQNLQAALSMNDKAALAALVDFRSLSEDFVQAVSAVYPQAAADETQRAEMRDEAQREVLKILAAKKSAKTEASTPRKRFAAVPFVPEDVIAQIAEGLKLETSADGAQLWSKFTHHGLQADFPLRLGMERRRDAWMVTRLLNAQELASTYKGAVDPNRAGNEAAQAKKKKKILARMRKHFNEPQCLAAINVLGNKHEAMLVVKVTAHNLDTTTLHHVNLMCDVRAGNGTQVYSRQLNVVQRVYGGGPFANTWTIVLDADSEDAVRLLRAGPLSCTVEPKVLSVGVGEVLYPRKND
jgi:hypothetical protein